MPFQEIPKDAQLDPVASGRFTEVPQGAQLDAASPPAKEAPGFVAEHLGAVTRGLAPVATGAAIGAAAGAPFAGVGAIPGAIAGGGAVALTELATSIYNPLAEHFGWPRTATPQEMTDRVADALGVAKPQSTTARMVETAAGGASGAMAEAKMAGQVAQSLAPSATKRVAETLATGPGRQAVSGATGGAAAELAGEMGLGPLGQQAAGLLGGSVVFPRAANLPKGSGVRPEAKRMMESGYVLPPGEVPPLEGRPSATSRALGAESGKIKLWQEASTKNQINTNKLAAKGIGLHPETMLTESAFEQARAPAKAVYQEVQQAIPEITLGADPAYRSAIEGIGGGKSLVEKYFPDMKDHPEIKQLREGLLKWGAVPTEVATAKIADLRMQASNNFKVPGDNQKHALALAQKEAANAMEESLERSITNAVPYNQSKLSAATQEVKEATRSLGQAQTAHANATKAGSVTSQGLAQGEIQRAQERLNAAHAEVAKWQQSLTQAQSRIQENATLAERFRGARKLFAKIYNVEDATNTTTGNVNARGLGRMLDKGLPLSDELKTIAEAANTAPKSMQVPETFGRTEDWSLLDMWGTAISVGSGHIGGAAIPLARPIVRRGLLGERYQKSMREPRQPSPSPLPLLLNPGAASAIDEKESTAQLMGLQ